MHMKRTFCSIFNVQREINIEIMYLDLNIFRELEMYKLFEAQVKVLCPKWRLK